MSEVRNYDENIKSLEQENEELRIKISEAYQSVQSESNLKALLEDSINNQKQENQKTLEAINNITTTALDGNSTSSIPLQEIERQLIALKENVTTKNDIELAVANGMRKCVFVPKEYS